MKKTVINIAVILIIVAATFGATKQWFPKVEDRTVTDTVRIDKPYPVEKIVEKTKPVQVVKWKTKYDTVKSVRVEKDTVFVDTNLNTFAYNARFLTNYPSAPKFLGAQYKDGQFDLTYLRTNGITRTKTWNVGDRGYRVGLNDGQPNIETFKENTTEFSYSVEGGYIRFFKYGGPYLQLSSEFSILGLNTTATINANRNPFGMIGIKYKFD